MVRDKLVEMWGRLRLAQEANLVQDSREVLATEREVVRAHHRRNLGDDFQQEGEMGDLHVGDVVHNHHQQKSKTGGSLLTQGLVTAGLLASGGIGASIPMLLGMTPRAEPQSFKDEDTRYELRLGAPDDLSTAKEPDP